MTLLRNVVAILSLSKTTSMALKRTISKITIKKTTISKAWLIMKSMKLMRKSNKRKQQQKEKTSSFVASD